MTATTKQTGQQDSDEENVTEQCPSPLPFKGSNAVSPDGEASKNPFRKHYGGQDGAEVLKVGTSQKSSHAPIQFQASCSNSSIFTTVSFNGLSCLGCTVQTFLNYLHDKACIS